MKLKFNADYHTYWLDGKQAKGVTTIAKIGTNTYNLEQYDQRMVAIGVAKTPALIEKIAVNFDDKSKMKDLCYEAKREAKAFAKSDRGTTLHTVTERHDLGLELIDTESNVKIRKAWAAALATNGLEATTDWVERIVVYPEYRLCGTLDRILYSTKLGGLVIADAKGGQNAIKYPHSIAVQLALYANAPLLAGRLNGNGETTEFDEMPNVDTHVGYVIWMPEDDRAEVVPIDIYAGWEFFNDVIRKTQQWQERSDLVLPQHTLTELLEASWPGSTNAATDASGTSAGPTPPEPSGTPTPSTAPIPVGSVNPPTTTSETTSGITATAALPEDGHTERATTATTKTTELADRLAMLKIANPDVAVKVKARWPYPGTSVTQLDSRQMLVVRLLVDRIEQGR